jgi:predicted Rossmann-fold nucleotide-binding protein
MNGMGSAFGGRSIDSDRRARRSVCVFCSSAGGLPEVHRVAARELGRELAGRGHRLVYGGGNVGLMGEVARSVHEHGGTVVGVIPQGLVDRELAYDQADELLVTATLRDHNDTFLVKTDVRTSQVAGASGSWWPAALESPWPAIT